MLGSNSEILPAIRGELRLIGRRRDAAGSELHIIYDPLRHRFFELQPLAARILAHWRAGRISHLMDGIKKSTGEQIVKEDITQLLQFLKQNEFLCFQPARPGFNWFHRLEKAIGTAFFFRVPLIHPDRLLTRIVECLFPLLNRYVVLAMIMTAVVGLLLVLRQWDIFLDGVRPSLNVGGFSALMLAIVFAKVVHELGHALTAKSMGCRVPTMGIAVMFGAPLLYTDLSDTWRLDRSRDRLLVASSGMISEMLVAAFATWGWLILPDGPARSACFFLATAAWVGTLAVNLNPFMRFDGYFMLSDFLGIPNLADRAFTLARWQLRRILWGINEECPDDAPFRLRWVMTIYGWMTWAFRSSLYIGLAFAVFHLLPKVIAAPLLLAELWVLVARPVVRELSAWWQARRSLLSSLRGRATLAAFFLLVLWLVVPQRFDLSLPAVVASTERQWISPPRTAILESHAPLGAIVSPGDLVAKFRDPSLDHELRLSRLRLAMLSVTEEKSNRDQRSARELAAIRQKIAAEAATLSGLEAQRDALTVVAPFAARIIEVADNHRLNTWMTPAEAVVMLASQTSRSITAFIDDRDIELVEPGARALFHPSPIDLPVLKTEIATVEKVPSEYVAEPILASIHGGPIQSEADAMGRAIPIHGQYKIVATAPSSMFKMPTAILGTLMVQSRPFSLINLVWKRLNALIAREVTA